MRAIDCLLVGTLNKGKYEEFRELFGRYDIKVAPVQEYVRNARFLKTVESEDPKTTFYENAHRKCFAAFEAAKFPTFADDSGLEVDALSGKPGVLSSSYATAPAGADQDAENRRKILAELQGKSNRKARFKCVLVFMVEGVELVAEGVCEGEIATAEKGGSGFGYDSIFIPNNGGGKTFAQMTTQEKAAFSHRALAVKELVEKLKDHEIVFVRP